MVSTSKRVAVTATALLAIAIAPAQSRQSVGDVPSEIIESMDPNMIDFVIAGFPKCGTTYLQNNIFYESDKVFIPHHETHFLANDKYEEFQSEFSKNATQKVVGYKSPFELGHQKSLRNLQALFPDVKMVITMRHPILQLQSLYNYELRHLSELIAPVENFVGDCREQCIFYDNAELPQKCLQDAPFCTGQASFHQFLSRLGLTPMNTPEELELLDHHNMSIHPFPKWRDNSADNKKQQQESFLRTTKFSTKSYHQEDETNEGNSIRNAKLFLIEIGQFDNWKSQSMVDDLNSDLEEFLGLEQGDLPRAPARQEGAQRPKTIYNYPAGREAHKLNICLDRYKPLRESLLQDARKAAEWISQYLLHPSNKDVVVVSNMDIFENMLEGWKQDPCSSEEEDAQ